MRLTLREKLALFDPALPLERAQTIPRVWYSDPEVADLERAAVFGAMWQPVARVAQFPQDGCFVTTEVAGEPILLVRDQGIVRALSNVCRHKATILEGDSEGCRKIFCCRYHRWTYDLSGRLHRAPEFEGVEEFGPQSVCLPSFQAVVWGPLVWVHLAANPSSVWTDFAPAVPDVSAMTALQFAGRREYDVGCNWKVYVENYVDGGYHVPTVHPRLSGALNYSEYRTELFPRCNLQSSPFRLSEDAAVTGVRSGEEARYWWLFPNVMVDVNGEGVVDTITVFPVAPDRCRVVFDFYYAPTLSPDFQERSTRFAHEVQLEDVLVCEEVQRGLGSRYFDTGRLSVRREAGVHHFHQILAQALRSGLEREEGTFFPGRCCD